MEDLGLMDGNEVYAFSDMVLDEDFDAISEDMVLALSEGRTKQSIACYF